MSIQIQVSYFLSIKFCVLITKITFEYCYYLWNKAKPISVKKKKKKSYKENQESKNDVEEWGVAAAGYGVGLGLRGALRWFISSWF